MFPTKQSKFLMLNMCLLICHSGLDPESILTTDVDTGFRRYDKRVKA